MERGGELLKNKNDKLADKKSSAKFLLNTLPSIAEKNATSLCRGFMYEPEIPKKLKKVIQLHEYNI